MAIETNPSDHAAYTGLGLVHLRMKDYNAALNNFNDALGMSNWGQPLIFDKLG